MGDEVLLEVLETLEEQAYRSLGDKRFIANFTADERELVETVLKECGDSVSFNFLFIEVTNAAEKIKCFIPDVLPSRISVLHDAAQYVHDTMRQYLNHKTLMTEGLTLHSVLWLDSFTLETATLSGSVPIRNS